MVYDPGVATLIQITDQERESWRKGTDIHYAKPRDDRKDIGNPFEYLDAAMQTYWTLSNLADRKTPQKVNDKLDLLKRLSELHEALSQECLAAIYEDRE